MSCGDHQSRTALIHSDVKDRSISKIVQSKMVESLKNYKSFNPAAAYCFAAADSAVVNLKAVVNLQAAAVIAASSTAAHYYLPETDSVAADQIVAPLRSALLLPAPDCGIPEA